MARLFVFAAILLTILILPAQSQEASPESGAGTVALASLLQDDSTDFYWEPFSKTGILVGSAGSVSIREGLSAAVSGGRVISLDMPVSRTEKGDLRFSEASAALLRKILNGSGTPQASSGSDIPANRIAVILIDPGHGGKAPGTVGTHTINGKQVSLKEKDLTLSVSKDLAAMLAKAYPDKRIVLTRDGDTYPSLEDRTDIANAIELKPDEAIIFISIHFNSTLKPQPRGYEVWYLPPEYRRDLVEADSVDGASKDILPILNSMREEEYTTESVLLANKILGGLDGTVGSRTENRGLKANSWYVVRKAKMPSVLLELGFVSNKEEATLLMDAQYLKNLALGIYNGVSEFVEHFEHSKGFTE